ncbi:hypothetical protein [Kocuria aegyptia]|uniref:Uncharacterized protein n=1 Tax=Kocuria aegyptia TaxID=330943 RepID=A0ABN2K3K6_9MICC
MNTTQRITAAAAAVLLLAATPAGATASEHEPPAEQPAEVQWPPASTHGRFVPFPEEFQQPYTVPACDSEITVAPGDVNEKEYRVLVTAEGDTVVEHRGAATVDYTRASDGAMLDEVDVSSHVFDTFYADGTTITFSGSGPGVVIASREAELQAHTEAGLPPAFLFLSGEVTGAITLESAPEPGQEPAVVSVEITENTTEYVFDLCDLLDQAAADQQATSP